jgi:hypothetical protein
MAKFLVQFISSSKEDKTIEAEHYDIKEDMITFWSSNKGNVATFPKSSIDSIEQV